MEKWLFAGFCFCLFFTALSHGFELPIEAESFQLIKGWNITDDGYFPSLPNFFSRQKIEADASDSFARAVYHFEVPESKTYRLWVRYESCYGFGSVFNVEIIQKNTVMAKASFGRKQDKKFFPFGKGETVQGPWDWHNTDYVYQSMEANLQKGKATIVLTKDKNEFPSARRIIDLFYLTDDLSLIPGDDWIWSRGNRPPILSRFNEKIYLKARIKDGTGAIKVITGFAISGAHPYAPRETYFIGKTGLMQKQPERKEYLEAGTETAWHMVKVYTVMVPELVISPIGDAVAEIDIAKGSPSNIVKTITITPGRETTVYIAIGIKKYEKGLLGDSKALTVDEMIKKQIDLLEKYNPPGKPAEKILLTGVIRDIFPELQFKLAVASGLNGQAYSVNPLIYGKDANLKGFNTETGFYALQNMHLTRECYEGNFSKLEARYKQIAEDLFKKLGRSIPLHIKILEETGPKDFDTLMSWQECKKMFDAYLSEQSLNADKVREDSDLFHYHSTRFRTLLFANLNAMATKLIEKYFPEGSVVNSGSVFPSIGGFPALGRGDDIFLLFKQRGVTEYSSEISWGLCGVPAYIGPQTQSYEAALARSLAKYHNCPLGSYLISAGPYGYNDKFVELASYIMYGSGFKWLNFYVFGWPDGCSYMGHPEIMKAVKRVNRKIGVVEDYLINAKVVPGEIAIGWSSTTDIWDLARKPSYQYSPGNCVYPQERHLLYLLLRHLQYPVEILSEEDLTDGYLKNFKVYFLVGDHLKVEAANALKEWVKNGGTLISVAGGGLYDHLNKPLETMKDVFGIKESKIIKTVDAIRPKLELLHMEPLDTIVFNTGRKMKVFGYRQSFVVSDGTVIGTFTNGEPAAVEKNYGRGKAIIIGGLFGPAYLKDAIPLMPYGRGGDKDELSLFFPTQYNQEVRFIVKDLLGGMRSNLICSHPLIEGVLLERENGYTITLTNFSMQKQKNVFVKFTPPADKVVKKIFSPYGKLGISKAGEELIIKIPEIDKFDCVIIECVNGSSQDIF